LIVTPEEKLCSIRLACERTIGNGEDALAENFVTSEDDATDLPEFRKAVEKAIAAAKLLLAHIDTNYDCGSGFAEVKEGSCLESK
jgi:hypothetical protein